MREYYRPQVQLGAQRPPNSLLICGGKFWFDQVEVITRSGSLGYRHVKEFPPQFFDEITRRRAALSNLNFKQPIIMGIVNLTPDSFSDGGDIKTLKDFSIKVNSLINAGAKIIDIGGESTRPGALEVSLEEEKKRVFEPLKWLSKIDHDTVVSLDTRKSEIAEMASSLNVKIINDVSAASFDENMLKVASKKNFYICLCHSVRTPETMSENPVYDNVLLDVYDKLERRVKRAQDTGVPKDHILIDPGIGFGKKNEHNLVLIKNISIFHNLGCPIVLGVSRKKFIKTNFTTYEDSDLDVGSIFYSLEGIRQGVQIVRVHNVSTMMKCLNGFKALWS